jgi:hypothetical protein
METYDPSKIVVTWNGVRMRGYAQGEFVKVEPNADLYNTVVGAGGQVARSRNPDESGKVTVTLLATSATNDEMTAKVQADRRTNTGWGPLMIKDLLGNTLVAASRAWIERLPDVGMSGEVGTRAWVIRCAELSVVVGGNLST